MLKILYIIAFVRAIMQPKPYNLKLTKIEKSAQVSLNYKNNESQNHFEVTLNDIELGDSDIFSIVFESTNPEFTISILADSENKPQPSTLMDLTSESGNIALVMSSTFFNGNLDFFKTYGKLRFVVYNGSDKGNMEYKVKAQVGDRVDTSLGRVYVTRVDATLNEMKIYMTYDGSKQEDLQKLRFQLTTVRYKQGYTLEANLRHKTYSFKLNNVFQKSVGGILTAPDLPVCIEATCGYELDIKLSGIKLLNIESFMIGKIEKLSINHYEEYYDKVYKPDSLTTYELLYEPIMHGMDISISLIPVTGATELYVNPQTIPLSLDKYTWQEKGNLAKRITVKWEELIQMKAEGTNMFITVYSNQPGEFLIKLDAHDPGLRGRLNSGIIEAGFVTYEEISNYLYIFEVFENQQITFDLRLNISSGDADLYVKRCENYQGCKIETKDLDDPKMIKVENNQSVKTIRHTFTCVYNKKHTATLCEFVIGVKGKENHGTHYDLTLHESNYHRLMIPGHSISINMIREEVLYLKFSYPSKTDKSMKLYLTVEPIWGDFTVLVSKNTQYPSEDTAEFKRNFFASNTGLLGSLENIEINSKIFNDYSIQGIYYLTVMAKTSCSLNLSFQEKSETEASIHSLTAGVRARGEITNGDKIMYYTMKLSLDKDKASTISINLTPIKGRFALFISRSGKMPTRTDNELVSENNILNFAYNDYNDSQDEYIIGVQSLESNIDADNSNQYLISFTYADKPTVLTPGLILTHTIEDSNHYLIQIIEEMNDLLVIKSIVDGHNIDLCGVFSDTDTGSDMVCDYQVNERDVSLYLKKEEINKRCAGFLKQGKICYFNISIKGNKNQRFSLGYTYNDHPFQLVKAQVLNGPEIRSKDHILKFICHPEQDKDMGIYLNTKGTHLKMYTKLVNSKDVHNENTITFPSADDYDIDNQAVKGHITNVWYSSDTIAAIGGNPELLISIVPEHPESNPTSPFNSSHAFVLQSADDAMEILRTQTHVELVNPGAWNYYHFYNNGNSGELRVYVSSNVATQIEVVISKNMHSRPPFTNKPLLSKIGLQAVELSLKPEDLKLDSSKTDHSLKGHYTVGVKSADSAMLSVYWNNKDDLNYIELTPGEPSIMTLDSTKKLYFSFYSQEMNKKTESDLGNVEIFIKSSVPALVYLLKTKSKSLDAPSKHKFTWKASLGRMGGITSITIDPKDPQYCMDCTYIGYIEAKENGTVSLIANIEHHNIPVLLTPGFTFPIRLEPGKDKLFRFFNPDTEIADFVVSMLSGMIDVYIGNSQEVNEKENFESMSLYKNLDIHKFISINPAKFNITEPHDFYLLAQNKQNIPSSFTVNIEKNAMRTPIEPGLTKFVRLGPGERNEMFYKPKSSEKTLELELELRQLMNPLLIYQAMALIHDFVNVYYHDEKGDKHMLMYKFKSVQHNRVYIIFDIQDNTDGTFAIQVFNPLTAGVYVSVYLSNGGYKLVHLNDYATNMITGSETQTYEVHSEEDKYVFFDIKTCIGDVNVSFYQSDFDKIDNQEISKHSTVKDANSFIHYIKVENKRLILEITNSNTDLSIFEMVVYNEKDLEINPISEIIQGDGGKIGVETDNHVLKVHPVKIKSQGSNDFRYRVTYIAYLTEDFKVMRYAKNCGRYKINQAFSNYHLKVFDKVIEYADFDDFNSKADRITIPLHNLARNTKYYGVVIARVELLPQEDGYVSAVRTAKAYYDEFIFVTPRYHIPPIYIMSLLAVLGFLFIMYCCIKGYVFGQIDQLRGMERLSDLAGFDNSILDSGIMGMLESDYFGDKPSTSTVDSNNETVAEDNSTKIENEGAYDNGIELSEGNETQKPLSE